MNELVILLVPLVAAMILAVVPAYRVSARINVVACLVSFVAAASLFWWPSASTC
jgi:hydrogenase-4 component F